MEHKQQRDDLAGRHAARVAPARRGPTATPPIAAQTPGRNHRSRKKPRRSDPTSSPCTLVLQAGASYPTCGRGVGSPVIALASKPETEISALLPHALLIRPDGILGRIAPDPAYNGSVQDTCRNR